jgi:CheY-like chemotaxis protein
VVAWREIVLISGRSSSIPSGSEYHAARSKLYESADLHRRAEGVRHRAEKMGFSIEGVGVAQSGIARRRGIGMASMVETKLRVLIADDELISRRLLEGRLRSTGFEVVTAEDGARAWEILESENAPALAILDWMMPGLDGPEICRRLRSRAGTGYVYVILLTARGHIGDLVAGLESGADDYVTKPFDWKELETRLRAGTRILRLQSELAHKVEELEAALAHVRTLQGLLPICMHCKSIRDDSNTWHRLETYIEDHSNAMFTHSLCKRCLAVHYPGYEEE